jgi:hypothetical protein
MRLGLQGLVYRDGLVSLGSYLNTIAAQCSCASTPVRLPDQHRTRALCGFRYAARSREWCCWLEIVGAVALQTLATAGLGLQRVLDLHLFHRPFEIGEWRREVRSIGY